MPVKIYILTKLAVAKCPHLSSKAWESYRKSKKNYNGFYKCNRCGKVEFSSILKAYFDEKNGIKRKTYLSNM